VGLGGRAGLLKCRQYHNWLARRRKERDRQAFIDMHIKASKVAKIRPWHNRHGCHTGTLHFGP
jgi:hypothetical protein